jgi:hypothetical protein
MAMGFRRKGCAGYTSRTCPSLLLGMLGTRIRKASQVSDPSRVKGLEATWASQVDMDADMNLGLPGGSSPASVEAMRLIGTWPSGPFAGAMSGINCGFDYCFTL